MPGLVGIASITGERVAPGLVRAMRSIIQHSNWYRVDDYVSTTGTVAVSRVYLDIINREKQPFSARNGKVKVFLRGEIYNAEVMRGDPLEYIYRLYEEFGLEFASFLNGSFLVVVVDEERNSVLVANDRLATKPLFYFDDGRAVYFSPEMKSLFLVPSLSRKLNLAAIADFLANGHFTREHTLIEGLKTMDKATVLEITSTGVTWHRYWEFNFEGSTEDRGHEYYREELAALLRQAVHRRLQTDRTYGILLSGGYDSRSILGCYLEARNGRELHTISWGRAEDIPKGDCLIARRLAHRLGADHRFYKLSAEEVVKDFRDFVWLGEGLTWFPESYQVFHRIREQQGVDIVLRGDECFGYSHWLTVHDEHTMFRALDLRALCCISKYQKVLKPHYYDLLCEMDADAIRQRSARCEEKTTHNRKDFFYLDVRLKHFLNPLNYAKNFSLESFTPLLDYDILDFVSRLPTRYRLRKRLFRQTVVEMFPLLYEEIAEIQDIIDWAHAFRQSSELGNYVYRELLEAPGILDEFVTPVGLKQELDAFFTSPAIPSARDRASTLLSRVSPTAFHLAHKGLYYTKRLSGRVRDTFPPERLILHLLILKVWGDVFLSMPVASTSN
jgi:asparagine synthase (glutamine-hydrolysing)